MVYLPDQLKKCVKLSNRLCQKVIDQLNKHLVYSVFAFQFSYLLLFIEYWHAIWFFIACFILFLTVYSINNNPKYFKYTHIVSK